MILHSLSRFCNPVSTARPSHIFYTVAESKNICRFGSNYGVPQPLYLQRIKIKPTISRRQEVRGMYSEKDVDLNAAVQAKSSSENNLLTGLCLFIRPYTIIGTILSIPSISTLALSSWTQLSPAFLWEVLKAVIPVILMNIYISGVNQVFDVEIDKVNKPYLPLASGLMSMELGIGVATTALITSLVLGWRYGSPAMTVVLVCLALLGTLYSVELPLMRWKRSPLLTPVAIMGTRALAIPFGYFIHMQKYVLGKPIALSRGIIFTSCSMIMFSIVIALSKDINDVEGDKIHGFTSFSITLGQERVFWICVSMLMAVYGGAIATGVSSSSLLNKIVSVLGHFSLASILMYRALQANNLDTFYKLVWKLFYAEYFLIPFMR